MKETYIRRLQELIQIPTVDANEEAVARYIQDWLAEHGIESKLVIHEPGRANLVAEVTKGEGPKLGLCGHSDVVASGEVQDWIYPPYAGEVHEGRLYGRGSSDMKGGLAAMVAAMIEAKESIDFHGTLRLLVTIAEETDFAGSKDLSQAGYADDLDAIIFGEPISSGVVHAHKGSYSYKLISRGKAVHSSAPQRGMNAIDHLRRFINRVLPAMDQVYQAYENPILGRTLHTISKIQGGHQVNSVPDYAEYEADMRTIPEFSHGQITDLLQELVQQANQEEGSRLELEVVNDFGPVQAPRDSALIRAIQQNAPKVTRPVLEEAMPLLNWPVEDQEVLDQLFADESAITLPVVAMKGATDATNFFQANPQLEIAVYGPGELQLCHQVDEYIQVDQYLDFITIYQRIIADYLVADDH
ncbi:ArgE/DapE family deacylase [Hutsoniella sourekii]|uniref:ArgE/DapE family deacylase n=1 Tax=Hutsoniella sourekii TaxID=87650 RepID=UPI0005599AB9|nr:ArgE/DapE family deacylase [Hutsoniella sourekii]